MTRAELLLLHAALAKDAGELMARKNHDYAGAGAESPFANFEVAERLGICPTETGILVRLTDKVKRLVEFSKAGRLEVENESVRDTVIDGVNYLVLLFAYLQHKAGRAT